jgi:hypothetical protein
MPQLGVYLYRAVTKQRVRLADIEIYVIRDNHACVLHKVLCYSVLQVAEYQAAMIMLCAHSMLCKGTPRPVANVTMLPLKAGTSINTKLGHKYEFVICRSK